YWRLNDHVRLTVHLDGRTERGAAGGVDVKYDVGPKGEGELKTYYTYDMAPMDKIDRETTNNIPNERYRVSLQHKQELPANIDLTVDVHKQSDDKVVEDFFPTEFKEEKEPQSIVDLTQHGPNYTLSVQARPQFP